MAKNILFRHKVTANFITMQIIVKKCFDALLPTKDCHFEMYLELLASPSFSIRQLSQNIGKRCCAVHSRFVC